MFHSLQESIFQLKTSRRRAPLQRNDTLPATPDNGTLLSLQFMKHPTDMQENCLYYIAGYVSRRITQDIECIDCAKSLFEPISEIAKDHPYSAVNVQRCSLLLRRKDRGGLKVPSSSVFKVVQFADLLFRYSRNIHFFITVNSLLVLT